MLVIHPAFYLSYVLPRDPQERLRTNKPLNRTISCKLVGNLLSNILWPLVYDSCHLLCGYQHSEEHISWIFTPTMGTNVPEKHTLLLNVLPLNTTLYYILDFKLLPCFKCRMFPFGLFPDIWSLNANVWEHSVCPIFIGELVWSVTAVEKFLVCLNVQQIAWALGTGGSR
jgi:hypothetical protein